MAKQPKKPSKTVKAAPKKATAKGATSSKPKAAPAKMAPAKAPATAKPKAAAKTKAKTTAKPNTAAKPKSTAKPKTAKPRTTKKAVAPAIASVHPQDGGGGQPANPRITEPLAGSTVTAGANLQVNANTNRPDLNYIIQLTDVTPPPAPPPVPAMPFQLPVTPTGTDFGGTIPGANLAPGRVYQIRVFVAPASGGTPPNLDQTITVNT